MVNVMLLLCYTSFILSQTGRNICGDTVHLLSRTGQFRHCAIHSDFDAE